MVFHWAARAIDLWLLLTVWLVEGWRRLPGDALGYLVMRGSGIAEPTRVVTHGDVTVRVVEDARVGRYLDTGWMPIHAQTIGHYVFARQTLDPRTLAHECEHVRQWRRLGPLYLPAYFGSSLLALLAHRHPYRDNPFEMAARERVESEFRS